MLEVRLARGLSLRAGGEELALPASRRARALLAYLALHPGAHARAQLAARFWPDVLDESARTSLRAALSELRRALGPAADHLLATRETVALDGAGLTVDTRAFEGHSTPRTRVGLWRRAARRSSTDSRTSGPTTRVWRTLDALPRPSSSFRPRQAIRRPRSA